MVESKNEDIDSDITINVVGDSNLTAGRDISIENADFSITQIMPVLPSILSFALPALVNVLDGIDENYIPPELPYEIKEKMDFNDLKIYRKCVQEYNEYGKVIDVIYEALDDNKPRAKKKIFQYLSVMYEEEKAKIFRDQDVQNVDEMNVIRNNADAIFSGVAVRVLADLERSNIKAFYIEEVKVCSYVIVSHGFINCRILEKVKDA